MWERSRRVVHQHDQNACRSAAGALLGLLTSQLRVEQLQGPLRVQRCSDGQQAQDGLGRRCGDLTEAQCPSHFYRGYAVAQSLIVTSQIAPVSVR